ncbi:MAG: hypothetical protein Q7T82_01640 [Armatimonadota bacterium]|nr:hypothetical protein [Armatimonadota bacterium]
MNRFTLCLLAAAAVSVRAIIVLSIGLALVGFPPFGGIAHAAVSHYTSEPGFRANASIASTETFDEFPRPSYPIRFYTYEIELDGVSYQTNKRLPDPGQAVWHIWDSPWSTVSAPGSLMTNAIGTHTISFGTGKRVGAIGFWFQSWNGDWDVLLNEANGAATLVSISHPLFIQYGPEYHGFTSDIGISSLSVSAVDRGHGVANWSYDEVSRSLVVVPEPSGLIVLLCSVSGLGGVLLKRRK